MFVESLYIKVLVVQRWLDRMRIEKFPMQVFLHDSMHNYRGDPNTGLPGFQMVESRPGVKWSSIQMVGLVDLPFKPGI